MFVILLVFTGSIAWGWVGMAAGGFAPTHVFNRAGLRQVGAYVAVGAAIWFAVYKSGVHPTVAGVLLGLLTPAGAWVGDRTLVEVVGDAWHRLREESGPAPEGDDRATELERLAFVAREGVIPAPAARIGPPTVGGVRNMPIFALANVGVAVGLSDLGDPVTLAVAAGLRRVAVY